MLWKDVINLMEHGKMSMSEALKMNVSHFYEYQTTEAITLRQAQMEHKSKSLTAILQRLDQLAMLVSR